MNACTVQLYRAANFSLLAMVPHLDCTLRRMDLLVLEWAESISWYDLGANRTIQHAISVLQSFLVSKVLFRVIHWYAYQNECFPF